jgi:GrpB-like predicted nucleotidyltransferase (UPF0157 family)
MAEDRSLIARLRAAGADPAASPVDAWRCLREHEGARATVLDLYELAARQRELRAHELPREERLALARSALPIVWPGFGVTGGSERRADLIEIVDHDPQWRKTFERWRDLLQSALGEVAQRVEHVGSTSVPGLPAKPIVDIQISVADLDDEPRYVAPLEGVGVQLRSRDDLHRYFRAFPDRAREVHVHLCSSGSAWEREHLLFRDYLRADAQARDDYVAAKRRAAALWADDSMAYTDAKSEAILVILDAARRWAASTRTAADGGAHHAAAVPAVAARTGLPRSGGPAGS